MKKMCLAACISTVFVGACGGGGSDTPSDNGSGSNTGNLQASQVSQPIDTDFQNTVSLSERDRLLADKDSLEELTFDKASKRMSLSYFAAYYPLILHGIGAHQVAQSEVAISEGTESIDETCNSGSANHTYHDANADGVADKNDYYLKQVNDCNSGDGAISGKFGLVFNATSESEKSARLRYANYGKTGALENSSADFTLQGNTPASPSVVVLADSSNTAYTVDGQTKGFFFGTQNTVTPVVGNATVTGFTHLSGYFGSDSFNASGNTVVLIDENAPLVLQYNPSVIMSGRQESHFSNGKLVLTYKTDDTAEVLYSTNEAQVTCRFNQSDLYTGQASIDANGACVNEANDSTPTGDGAGLFGQVLSGITEQEWSVFQTLQDSGLSLESLGLQDIGTLLSGSGQSDPAMVEGINQPPNTLTTQ